MSKKLITRTLAVGVMAACLAVGAFAMPASAGRYASAGPIGSVGLPAGICRYYNAWNRLDVQVYAPNIYAPNRVSGYGNDAAYARYQVYVVDRYGRRVLTSSFSGYGLAWDNKPVAFSGGPLTFTNIPEFSKVEIGVEWVGSNYTGAALYRLDKYVLYSGGSGPYASPDSCSKWTVG